jgi:hypothetical protein
MIIEASFGAVRVVALSAALGGTPSEHGSHSREGDGTALLKPPHSISSSFAHAFHASQLF